MLPFYTASGANNTVLMNCVYDLALPKAIYISTETRSGQSAYLGQMDHMNH